MYVTMKYVWEVVEMKKVFALVLAFALVMSMGVLAFAEKDVTSPQGGGSASTVDLGWGPFTVPAPAKKGMELYNSEDKLIAVVEEEEIIQLPVGQAAELGAEDEEAFLAAYEDAKAVEGKVVKYFYWIDIPEKYKTEDFAWAKYEFKCAGENVEVTVNGNPMEVVHVDGVDYYAKLTEFGAIAIMCD